MGWMNRRAKVDLIKENSIVFIVSNLIPNIIVYFIPLQTPTPGISTSNLIWGFIFAALAGGVATGTYGIVWIRAVLKYNGYSNQILPALSSMEKNKLDDTSGSN